MYDEIEIREIVFDAQCKIDKLFPGLKVVVVEDERKITKEDVAKALRDRQRASIDATNEIDYTSSGLDHALYSSPKWTVSSRNQASFVLVDDVKTSTPIKKSYFRRYCEQVWAVLKSY